VTRARLVGLVAGFVAGLAMLAAPLPTRPAVASPDKPLVLAHFYQWFSPTSWNRAKLDYPLAGRYSSDDEVILRAQVEQAKSAGIDGFIVSWKSSSTNNERLAKLVEVATAAQFKLALTYQGLDFRREPLPATRISADLTEFADKYAASATFDIFGKPLVVLTGTPSMPTAELVRSTAAARSRLLVLASEKDLKGYQRVAPSVDGNLYYWSSVDPRSNEKYAAKLAEMGSAVRAHGGIWIAPVAPGFDARMVGGRSNVPRDGGATLRAEWVAATASRPDAIGIISWNEFSENTYIEPSAKYGDEYLRLVAHLTRTSPLSASDFDSSEPDGPPRKTRVLITFAISALAIMAVTFVALRRRRAPRTGR